MPKIPCRHTSVTRLLLAALLCFTSVTNAAPKAELWKRWQAHVSDATETVNHAPWTKFLQQYVKPNADGIHRIAYNQVSPVARQALNGYINTLANTPVSRLNRHQQRAYWINLYNALTVQTVLAHYPVKSIRDIRISPGWFSVGPWDKKLVQIESEKLSLNDIEHRILRPIWQDPRIHYALNCASLGCPNLQPRAFTADNSEALLDTAAREFINHPRAVSVRDGRLHVSSIYVWFGEDFGDGETGLLSHLRKYTAEPLATKLRDVKGIASHDYDWALNDAL